MTQAVQIFSNPSDVKKRLGDGVVSIEGIIDVERQDIMQNLLEAPK